MRDQDSKTRRTRLILLLVFTLFLLPLAAAWILNFGIEDWRPAQTTNHGELVTPARPLKQISLVRLDGSHLPANILRTKWTLLYISRGECAEACWESLYKMRQVRLAQRDNIDRVQRLMIVTDSGSDITSNEFQQAWPGLVAARPVSGRLSDFLAQFELAGTDPVATMGRVYLVDPLGNLMMSYEADADPGGMVKDLARLLKISFAG